MKQNTKTIENSYFRGRMRDNQLAIQKFCRVMESLHANKQKKNRSQQEKLLSRIDELVDNVKRGAYVWKEDKCIYAKRVA